MLDTAALIIYDSAQRHPASSNIISFDSMNGALLSYEKTRLVRLWSVKDFGPCDGASDAHFFNTFGLFGPAIAGNEASMLRELKRRAIVEHDRYLEMMFIRPALLNNDPAVAAMYATYSPRFHRALERRDIAACAAVMGEMLSALKRDFNADAIAARHHDHIASLRDAATLPDGGDSAITVRFLNYVVRVVQPADVFAQLYLSFASCDNDSMLVGVNIVAPENNDVAIRDYWLHMQMFRYLRRVFPRAHVSLHAGELRLGMVNPEELTWHITSAVETAGADRIGHGVDIAYEQHAYDLLATMRARHVAVEINLTSNAFILGVNGDAHPIGLYAAFRW